jgi:hypothetical protein
MQTQQAATTNATRNLAGSQPKRKQLPSRNHPMLPPRYFANRPIRPLKISSPTFCSYGS